MSLKLCDYRTLPSDEVVGYFERIGGELDRRLDEAVTIVPGLTKNSYCGKHVGLCVSLSDNHEDRYLQVNVTGPNGLESLSSDTWDDFTPEILAGLLEQLLKKMF